MVNDALRSKRRWQVAGFFFLSGIVTATWNSRIPDVQQGLGLNDSAWGFVLTALPVGLVAGLFVSSWLVAKFGTQRMAVITSAVACIGLFFLGIAGDRWLLMAVLFLIGFNRTIMNIAINTGSVEVQRLYEKPVVSTFHGVWSAACFVAAGIGTVMIIFSIITPIHFSIVAVLSAIGLFFNRRNFSDEHIAPQKKPLLVKPDRYLLLLGLTAFFSMAAENTMFEWSVNYFDKVVKPDRRLVTAGFTCFIVMMTLGRLIGDKLIHRLGYINLLLFNGLLMAGGFAIASLFPNVWIASVGFLLVGFGTACIVPIVYSLAAKSNMPPAYAIASVTTIGYVGFLVNPLIVGFVSDWFGMRWSFGLMVVFALCVSFLALRIKTFQNELAR